MRLQRLPFPTSTLSVSPPHFAIIPLIQIPCLCRLRNPSYTRFPHRSPTAIKLWSLLTLDFLRHGNGLISSESFPHINHASFAFAIALFELLTAGGETVEKRGAETIYRFVALDEYAVGVLEACS